MRDIPGYESLYAVTSCGKVYSYRAKKFLKPRLTKKGYCRVLLYKDGKGKDFYIHRLVSEAYLDNPENLSQVNHKDEDKSNNSVQNLEYCDAAYNTNYGTGKERSAKSRQKKVICIETQEIFDSVTEAAKAVDVDKSSISRCIAGRQKTCAGYHWKQYDQKEEM